MRIPNRFLIILSVCLFSGIVFVAYKITNKSINYVPSNSNTTYKANGLSDLENDSDLIVRAKILPDSEIEIPSKESVYHGITYTDI